MQPHFAPDVIVERDPERGVRKKDQLRDDEFHAGADGAQWSVINHRCEAGLELADCA